jgi:hypothetical protein
MHWFLYIDFVSNFAKTVYQRWFDFFLSYFYSYFFLSCLNALDRNLSTTLNKRGENGHYFLIPNFRWNASRFSLCCTKLVVGFSYIAFIILRYALSSPTFLGAFFHEGMLNFVKRILCINWDDLVIFVLHSVYVLYCTYWCMLNYPWKPGMKLT